MAISVFWQDRSGLDRLSRAMEQLSGARFQQAAARGLNNVGGKARTQVRRTLTAQTGLPRRTIVSAIKERKASASSLAHVLSSAGGNVRLKFFGAEESGEGVVASPFGRKTMFPGAFIKAGSMANRKATDRFGGHAMYRVGAGRFPVAAARSGVVIPDEMVEGASRAAWNRTIQMELPRRLTHDLTRAGAGVFG